MALPKNRNACMSDLRAYFKKSELLGGLTDVEINQIKVNLKINEYLGEGGEPTPVDTTHENLIALINTNKLVTGARYRISNFRTIYESNVLVNDKFQTWGLTINPSPVRPLIVTGISNNRLDNRAYFEDEYDWIVEYDVRVETLSDGVPTKGKITYLKDKNGNSAFYNFKDVKFRRDINELRNTTNFINQSYLDFYTFSRIENGVILDNSETEVCEYNTIKDNSWNNVFLGTTKNNIFEAEFRNNTFINGCNDCHFLWSSKNNFFVEQVGHTTGTLSHKEFLAGDNTFSFAITKQIHIVYDRTIVTFLDPTTYSHQIVFI